MTEPQARADKIENVTPDVWMWTVTDDRIGFVSTGYAFTTGEATILVDPLPLEPDLLGNLGAVEAIVLTSGSHQRSSWRLRQELGAPVWAPAGVRESDEEPDNRYSEGDDLPGGLAAYFTPGAGTTQHTLILERGGVAFTGDLLVLPPGAPLTLTPKEYVHDPAEHRRSVERLLGLDFEILCTGHGGAVVEGAKVALQRALDAAAPQSS
jgi:glyoxylase-like metal-dependent hydrolase (beta-lactamase superfamily II)